MEIGDILVAAIIVGGVAALKNKEKVSAAIKSAWNNWKEEAKKTKSDGAKQSIYYPALLTIVLLTAGIVALNLLVKGAFPETWSPLWNNQAAFWTINLGVFVAIILLLIKAEDKRIHPIAKYLALFLLFLVAVKLIKPSHGVNVLGWPWWDSEHAEASTRDQKAVIGMDAALHMIGECETGNRHFEPDGKTVIVNEEGSSAVGKYQILESAWGEKAKKLGHDLRDESGQRAMAEYIFQNHGGFQEWEKDPRTKACLERKLAGVKGGEIRYELTVNAPPKGEKGDWSQLVRISPGLSITYAPQLGNKLNIRFNQSVVQTLDPAKGSCFSPDESVVNKDQCYAGATDRVEFQSTTDKPEPVLVKFFPYKKI